MEQKELEKQTERLIKKMQTPAWQNMIKRNKAINQAECYEDGKDLVDLLKKMEKERLTNKENKFTFKTNKNDLEEETPNTL